VLRGNYNSAAWKKLLLEVHSPCSKGACVDQRSARDKGILRVVKDHGDLGTLHSTCQLKKAHGSFPKQRIRHRYSNRTTRERPERKGEKRKDRVDLFDTGISHLTLPPIALGMKKWPLHPFLK
jgi:hypothetical protein